MSFKNKVFLLVFMAFLVLLPTQAFAAVNVYVAGKEVVFDTPPIIDASANRTLVPFRHIFEALGAEVWYDATQDMTYSSPYSAFGKKGDLIIRLPVNRKVAFINNDQISLDVATRVVNERVMVPLRFISESLGCNVNAQSTSTGLKVYLDWNNPKQPENSRALQEITTKINDANLLMDLHVEDGENKIFKLDNPKRLVIDFKDTTNQVKEIINLNNPWVSAVRTNQFDNTTTRVVLDLNTSVDYQLKQNNNSLLIEIKPIGQAQSGPNEPSQQDRPVGVDNNLIILDPGHGGSDPGAIGYSGKYEKDLVFSITNKLKVALENKGYTVVLTRSTDTYVSLADRVNIANNTNAFAFVSIHANSATNPSAKGLEVYTMYGTNHTLAQIVLDSILNQTGQVNRKVKEAGYYVIKNTDMPSILIETGFISNPQEEEFLWNEANQNKIVQGIVDGLRGINGYSKT